MKNLLMQENDKPPPITDPVVKLVLGYIIGLRNRKYMPQKRYKPEDIINKLREAEVGL